MKITRELLREWEACYSDERIVALVPESGLTPLQVTALSIPIGDILWVLLREEVIPARELRLLACNWARLALELVPESERDPRSLAAVETAERFARGEASEAELDSARAAAWDATRDARDATRDARDAASAAASAAAWAAAWYAWAATWAAARAAAKAAAWYVALDAARDAQLTDVVEVLRRLEAE